MTNCQFFFAAMQSLLSIKIIVNYFYIVSVTVFWGTIQ